MLSGNNQDADSMNRAAMAEAGTGNCQDAGEASASTNIYDLRKIEIHMLISYMKRGQRYL